MLYQSHALGSEGSALKCIRYIMYIMIALCYVMIGQQVAVIYSFSPIYCMMFRNDTFLCCTRTRSKG
jgi:hypothetical protein